MDTQSLYYIKKYNNLIEQINRLKHENNLLEGLASGTLSDPQRDTTTSASSSSTSSSNPTLPNPTDPDPTDPDSPGGPANPPPQTYYDLNRPRGTSIRDIASLSNRNFVNNFGL